MRVHELAKDLSVPTKELMEELRLLKVQVEHHSNALDDETVRKLRMIYHQRRGGGGGVVKKVTRRAGQPIPVKKASTAPQPPTSFAPPPPPPAPTGFKSPPPPPLIRRPQGPAAAGPPPLPRPAFTPPGAMPVPEGPSIRPILPPPPPPPMSIAPPTPLPGAPVLPSPSPSAMPPTLQTPASAQPGQSPPPQAKRPAKSKAKGAAQPGRKGTSIDLNSLKSIITPDLEEGGLTLAPKAPKSGRGRRRGGENKGRGERDVGPRRHGHTPPVEDDEKKFRPSFLIQGSTADRRRDAKHGAKAAHGSTRRMPEKKGPKAVKIYGQITLGEFAEKIGVPAMDLIKKLMELGEMVTINAVLNEEIAEMLAEENNIHLTVIPETDEYDVREFLIEDTEAEMTLRPPVVTVMGHVDHGKTSLLDKIRQTSVADGEAGGITQHIGASVVKTPQGDVTFLDTPGHEAFTAMRARGADVTDLVILIIAADDGIKPQTIEAINHAKAAEVPIVVAINKTDVPGANVDRVKQEIMNYGLVPEDFGGENPCLPVSAKTGEGIDALLEMLALQAEVLELRSNPNRPGEGVVIESRVEPGRGVTATVLVQRGTLKRGDVFVSGPEYGKIRMMLDDHGDELDELRPGYAAEITGLKGAPIAGEPFLVMPNEKVARQVAEKRSTRRRTAGLTQAPLLFGDPVDLLARTEEQTSFKVIVRADVQGSAEAISQSLRRLEADDLKLEILHQGVGAITVSDVNLASTAEAHVIGFGVRPEAQAQHLAEQLKVPIHLHTVIYELIDDIKAAMGGLLEPTFKELIQGRAEIRQVFRISGAGNIAGCYVNSGEIQKTHLMRLLRDDAVVTSGRKVSSLKRFKDDVARVQNGMECGIALEGFNDVKEGDIIEAYTLEAIEREITMSSS